jgi:ParB family transcriptional regulator, chromosome partitioning protein
MTESTAIALNKLLPWAGNVRKTDAGKGIGELAASIAAHGLLQSLVVRKDKRGKYAVVAGQRRLLALKSLAEAEIIDLDRPIPCTVIERDADGAEISLAENVQREAMHPADEFDAFQALIDRGTPIADVAARFGVSENVVKQRLKLANVSPLLIEAYRASEMSLQHVMAFAVTDDHAVQERVWGQLKDWQKDNPENVRRMLIEGEVTADDRRVKFVTLEAYQQAGGSIRRDLFTEDEHGVFIDDIALLESLVAKKLEATAADIRAQGWKWIEIRSAFDYEEWAGYDHVFPEAAPLLPEQQEKVDLLTAEAEALAEIEELDDEQQARLDALNDRLDELQDTADVWPAETLSISGAVVTLGSDGEADIRYGYVRPEDATASESPAKTSRKSKSARPPLPASLVENLTALRSAALTAALMERSDIALASTVHTMATQLFYGGSHPETALQITARLAYFSRVEESSAAKLIGDAGERWAERIPCNPDDLFAWCVAQDAETLMGLLAFCVANTVNTVLLKADKPASPRFKHADQLAQALKLDMTAWFTPTALNYFAKVSKAAIIEAMREVLGASAPAWEGMKKVELAALAERKIAGTGWLPAVLRAPAPEADQPVETAA